MRTTIGAMQNSIKTATDIAVLLRQSNLSFQRAELKAKLADLERALAEARSELTEIQQVLSEKDTHISKLEEEADAKGRMVLHFVND
jgi:chromosome segregation ATPase